jgi:hypothetical protein
MFLGTTPRILSQYIEGQLGEIKPKRILVPFAGNFVIEQVAAIAYPKAQIHSTDINLYSRLVGYGLAGMETDIKLKPEILAMFPGFKGKNRPEEEAAIALFFSEVAQAIKKQKIPYYGKILEDAKTRHEEYYRVLIDKITRAKELIGDIRFYGIDAHEFLKMAGKGDFIYYDSPTIKGGYERMFQAMEGCYDFDSPEYTEITPEVRAGHLQSAMDHKAVMFCNSYYPENWLEEVPAGYEETFRWKRGYNKWISIFSNREWLKWVFSSPLINEKQASYPVITEKDVINENTRIHVIESKADIVNHYRLMWVKKADIKSGAHNFMIFADEKLIGCAVLNSGVNFGMDFITIFSDPASPTSRYARLSKLILYVICMGEMIDRINDLSMWEHKGFTTAVFTNYEVSMKYRSLFTLAKKETLKTGGWKYKLIYQNRLNILPTYQDGLKAWLKNEGQIEQTGHLKKGVRPDQQRIKKVRAVAAGNRETERAGTAS